MSENAKEHEVKIMFTQKQKKSQCTDINEQCFKTAVRRRKPKASKTGNESKKLNKWM